MQIIVILCERVINMMFVDNKQYRVASGILFILILSWWGGTNVQAVLR